MRLLQCLNPTSGFRLKGVNPKTGRKFGLCSAETARRFLPSQVEEVAFRCGKCLNCLKYRGSVLMARCVAEMRMHDDNAFITLTVDDDNISEVFPNGSLFHRPFQLFCKRLRKRLKCGNIKYMMCGEYGELSFRPHYHAIVFGLPAYVYENTGVRRPDGMAFLKSRKDNPIFKDCWPFGDVFCGTVTEGSIAYVSGYTLKQYVLGRDDEWYRSRGLSPEYVKWSRRPGLGRSYFEKYNLLDKHANGVIDCGVPVNDRRLFAGRYFLDWLRLTASDEYDKLLLSYGRTGDSESEVFDMSSALAERSRHVDTFVHRVRSSKRS